MPPRRRGRGAAKIASKVEERSLLGFLAALGEDPAILVPETPPGLRFWRLRRVARRLRSVHALRERPGALGRKARGKRLDSAFAAALLLVRQGHAPRLAMARLPWGEVKYAIRGMVPKEYHLAVQHADDPRLRALGFEKVARRSGTLVYCLPERTVARSRDARPPEGFVEAALEGAGVDWLRDGDAFRCPHPDAFGCHVEWVGDASADACRACLRAAPEPLLAALVRPVAGVDPRRELRVAVRRLPWSCAHAGPCATEALRDAALAKVQDAYWLGAISEAGLLDAVEASMRERLAEQATPLLVAGRRCFGQDADAFVGALEGRERERALLRRLMGARPRPLLLDDATTNKALLAYWADERAAIVRDLVGDEDAAGDLLIKHRDAPPSQVLEEAHRVADARKALDRLPRYRALPSPVREMDAWARADRGGSAGDALRLLDEARSRESMAPFCYAFLAATGQQASRSWQYQPNEVEFGRHLAPLVRALLDAEGDAYHDALLRLAREAGVVEAVERA